MSDSVRAAASQNIITRNRANALKSTGPKTREGKAISRLNAIKHGLCANPASGVAENPDEFQELLHAMRDSLQPKDPIEDGLVHRIAVSQWRLQRSARIDSAICNIGANAASSARERARLWVDRITDLFGQVDLVKVTDRQLIALRISQGLMRRGDTWRRLERTCLTHADELRDNELMQDGGGIAAMAQLIDTLMDQLTSHGPFGPVEAQMLAWLMGESVERLRPAATADDQQAIFYPDEKPWASRIDSLIGESRKRPDDTPIPAALLAAVEARMLSLHAQADIVADPRTNQQDRDWQQLGLLPEAGLLDRLMRYENQAERSFHKSLEVLAKYRGMAIESIAAAITRPAVQGPAVSLIDKSTQWRKPRAEDGMERAS